MKDLVLTLDGGIKTVREVGGTTGAEAILLTSSVDSVPPGVSPIAFELPPVQTNPPNPTGPFVAESGGVRITRTGWYLFGSPIKETSPLVQVDFQFVFDPPIAGFGAQVDTGIAPIPFPIPAGTLVTIQANNMEAMDQGIENRLFWVLG